MSDEPEPETAPTEPGGAVHRAVAPQPDRARWPGRHPLGTAFWVFLTLVVALLVSYLAGLRFLDRSLDKGKDAIEGAAATARETFLEVVDRFQPERVVETFREWRELTMASGDGSRLEVATAEASERFVRSTDYRIWGKRVPQTWNVSEILVPATYRFHIDLDGEWELLQAGSRLVVRAPPVRPTLPVAFDTGQVEKRTTAGWARWDAAKDLEELEKGISEGLAGRAAKAETIARAEEAGRLVVARFVRDWLVSRQAWGNGAFQEIVVVFGDSQDSGELLPPALRLDLPAEQAP